MRLTSLALLFFATGCSTVVPMQTASAVDRGRFRVGAQGSGAGFCGDIPGGVLGITRCTEYPDGIPLPEIRVNTRYGLGHGFDVGASVQAQGQIFAPERPFQLGLTLDVKGELLRIPTSGPTHILSTGILGGAAMAGRLGLPLWSQVEWGVPFFYGLQLSQWELVAGINLSQRLVESPNVTPAVTSVRTGFTLGLFKRNPAGFALQLGYLTDPARFSSGTIQLQLGLFFDVG